MRYGMSSEEQADLDIWMSKDNHFLYLEDWWGIETKELRYGRIKKLKEDWEKGKFK